MYCERTELYIETLEVCISLHVPHCENLLIFALFVLLIDTPLLSLRIIRYYILKMRIVLARHHWRFFWLSPVAAYTSGAFHSAMRSTAWETWSTAEDTGVAGKL